MTPAEAVTAVIARALDWQRETGVSRCSSCGARVGRLPAELALDKAVEEYKAAMAAKMRLPKRAATFDSEAPTEPRKRRK